MVHTERDISYTNDTSNERNRLDVYYSQKDSNRDVLVFVPGGAWETANKNTYSFLGKNFVRKGLCTVVINYNLSPNPIERILQDCTAAIVWVYNHIVNYGGNPNRIFVMGHSAGGHMIELINSDPQYFAGYRMRNPIYGIILLDAFGLDMYDYLSRPSSRQDGYYNTFIQVFSNDPRNWKQKSPLRYWKNIRNPQLILIGERTYPSIRYQNRHLYEKLLSTRRVPVEFHEIPRRNHRGMVAYMFFSSDQQYDIILNFIRRY